MNALAIVVLTAFGAWSYVEAGRARFVGWALWRPTEAAPLLADLAVGASGARLHAVVCVLVWPIALRHLPTVTEVHGNNGSGSFNRRVR